MKRKQYTYNGNNMGGHPGSNPCGWIPSWLAISPGTRTWLFGIHSFLFHSWYVWKAWKMLFGRPTLKYTVAILLHDIGYLGLKDLSKDGSRCHVMLGAVLTNKLTGYPKRGMIFHSSEIAHKHGYLMSWMGIADKVSIALENDYFYAFRTWLTGEAKYYYSPTEKHKDGEDPSFMGTIRFKRRYELDSLQKAIVDLSEFEFNNRDLWPGLAKLYVLRSKVIAKASRMPQDLRKDQGYTKTWGSGFGGTTEHPGGLYGHSGAGDVVIGGVTCPAQARLSSEKAY